MLYFAFVYTYVILMNPCINYLEAQAFEYVRASYLVHTLERRDSLALIFVESGANHRAISQLNVGFCSVVLEGQSVLHPFLIVALERGQ